MKSIKYIIGIISAFLLLAGCQEEQDVVVKLAFNQSSYELTAGGATLDLAAELLVENSDKKPVFESSDEAVATVTATGSLTPVAPGTVEITATVADKSAVCTIIVKAAPQLTLTSEPSLVVGVSNTITATSATEGFDPKNLEWTCTSTPDEIVEFTKVDDWSYTVKCVEYKPSASVTVTVKDKTSSASASVTMPLFPEVKTIVLSETSLTRKVNDQPVQLHAACYAENEVLVEGYDLLEWGIKENEFTIGNPVEVDQNGVLTFKEYGTATVFVVNKYNRAVQATCIVNVANPDVIVETITLSPSSKVIKLGDKFSISALVEPENAYDKTLTYESSDEKIASVSESGEVEGLGLGRADITVSASNGVSAVCKVLVSEDGTGEIEDIIPVEEVLLETETKENIIYQLEPLQMIAYYMPTGSTPKSAEWSTSDETLATIDQNGLVTVVLEEIEKNAQGDDKEYSVEVRLTVDGKYKAYSTLEIKRARPKSVKITSEPENHQIILGQTFQYKAIIEPSLAEQDVIWQCFEYKGDINIDDASILNGISYYEGTLNTNVIGVGKYIIQASAHVNDNVYARTLVEVLPVEIESASLDKTELSLSVGAMAYLKVSFTPANATYKEIQWTSSAENVATIASDGKVTAVAAGDAVITATLSNGMQLKCNVTVSVDENAAKVGDFFYSDGTWSTELDNSKTVVGIVFSVDNVTLHDAKLAAEHSDCTHGLVASIINTPEVKWQGWRSDINTWAVNNGYMPLSGVDCPSGTSNFYLTDNGKKLCGYNNTAAIEAYKMTEEYAKGGDDVKIYLLDNMSSMTDVDNTSGWYVPSIAELNLMAASRALLNEKFSAVGGEQFNTAYGKRYWSSTEGKNSDTAVNVNFFNGTVTYNDQKSRSYFVRYVFAF